MSATPRSVLIVGASLAGHATARALRRQGFDGRITLVGAEPERPYDRPPLSKEFLAGTMDDSALALEASGEDLAAEWILGASAVALDAAARSVTLADGRVVTGEAVVIATGSQARRLADAPAGVHTVRTLADTRALRSDLQPGMRVAVIGAGFIGSEIASTLSTLGQQVTVVETAPAPLAGPLGVPLGAAVAGLHERNGVTVRCGTAVAGLAGSDRVTGLELADGSVLPTDLVVAGIGADPAVDWLAGSGLDLSSGVVCSAAGATGAPGIWAVGDCSAWYDEHRGRAQRIEHWTDSRDRPAAMVRAMLGGAAGSVRAPYFWSDQYGSRIQFAGRRHGDEDVEIEAGGADGGDLLAVYRRAGQVVAVLGIDQPALFMRHRKALLSSSTAAVTAVPDGAVPAVPDGAVPASVG